MSKTPRQVDNGPSQHMSVKERSLKAFCNSALLVFFKRPFNLCHNHVKHIR